MLGKNEFKSYFFISSFEINVLKTSSVLKFCLWPNDNFKQKFIQIIFTLS